MARVMTAEEYAAFSGCDLERLKAQIAEAEAGAITAESMDPSTLRFHNWSSAAEERCRELMRKAQAAESPED